MPVQPRIEPEIHAGSSSGPHLHHVAVRENDSWSKKDVLRASAVTHWPCYKDANVTTNDHTRL